MRFIKPFTLPYFKEKGPTLSDFKKPFFKTDDVTLSTLENLVVEVRRLVTEDDTTATFWLNLHNVKIGEEYRFRELTYGVIKMLCIPFSNAEVERDFSAISVFKTNRRCLISTELLENMLYCKFGLKWMGITVQQFNPPMEMLNYYPSQLYEETHEQYKNK